MPEQTTTTPPKSIFTRMLEWIVITLMFLLTIDVLWGVFSRYVLGHQSQWTDELATTLLIWVAMLAAALAYAQHAHLGIDYLVLKCSPAVRAVIECGSHLLVIAFSAGVMVYGGWMLSFSRFQSGQSMAALGISKGFFYLAVPVAGLFIVCYATRDLYNIISKRKPIITEHHAEDVDV